MTVDLMIVDLVIVKLMKCLSFDCQLENYKKVTLTYIDHRICRPKNVDLSMLPQAIIFVALAIFDRCLMSSITSIATRNKSTGPRIFTDNNYIDTISLYEPTNVSISLYRQPLFICYGKSFGTNRYR